MKLSNLYNFRNPVRHFINIDDLNYPTDIETFNPDEVCWTKPFSFRIYKADDKFRTLKIPNILNFVRAYHYYKGRPCFTNVMDLDPQHKRLAANLETGDFVSGNYNKQVNDDFLNLCNYDVLVKLDISEYYGRIYTHYLDLEASGLKDTPLAWLNNGRTSGILMGNYLSLYFAEYLSSRISNELQENIDLESLNCVFNYFSDDFYFFCNNSDVDRVVNLFDSVLAEFDFSRKGQKQIWNYETYNTYNLLTRFWKATIRAWNLEVLKDYDNYNKHPETPLSHKYSFLNQLIYRMSQLKDEKSKKGFIVNFFKTKHFQSCDFSDYKVCSYDLHQLFFLIKYAPESLLYIAHTIAEISDIKDNEKTKEFFKARYEESLKQNLNDVQLFYYYAIKILEYEDIIAEATEFIIASQNQVLISYYLKDGYFNEGQISSLKIVDGEEYWFQNYHLILFTPSLYSDLDASIEKYLKPKRLIDKPNAVRENRFYNFYHENLENGNELISEISAIKESIGDYLDLRHEETANDFDDI